MKEKSYKDEWAAERKLFEAEFGPYGLSRCNAPGDDLGGYQSGYTNLAWKAWKIQASRFQEDIILREDLYGKLQTDLGFIVANPPKHFGEHSEGWTDCGASVWKTFQDFLVAHLLSHTESKKK